MRHLFGAANGLSSRQREKGFELGTEGITVLGETGSELLINPIHHACSGSIDGQAGNNPGDIDHKDFLSG